MTRLDTDRTARPGRSVPLTFGTATAVLVTLAVALALSTPPPSTPPIGAVAPQVQEQVEVERQEQGSRFGAGGTGDPAGATADCPPDCDTHADAPRTQPTVVVTTGAGASPSPGTQGQLRNCVFGPGGARQTDDPQSPPCVQRIFEGDNGGSTWQGVTAREIRVAMPRSLAREDDERALVEHFNRNYEFYGRQLVVDLIDTSGFDSSPESRRALAREIAARGVFAALGVGGAREAYHRTLADAGVVSVVAPTANGTTEAFLSALHPHVWSVDPTREQSFAAAGALICRSLNGRPASHGGDDVADLTRRFGLLVETSRGDRVDPAPLTSALEACGAPYGIYEHDQDGHGHSYEQATPDVETVLRRMREDGTTSIVCLCHDDAYKYGAATAEAIGYHPEWIIPGLDDSDLGDNVTPREQRAHQFGLTSKFRRISFFGGNDARYEEQYWYHAMKETDPTVEPENGNASYSVYAQLLVLASGIQAAGPELTADTFGAGLSSLRFPNPGVGEAPWFQPAAGFGPGDHGFNSDFALVWWQNLAAEVERARTAKGTLCYVGNGRRYAADQVPADADRRFFDAGAGCR